MDDKIKKCVLCEKELAGRQQKYCSIKCIRNHWSPINNPINNPTNNPKRKFKSNWSVLQRKKRQKEHEDKEVRDARRHGYLQRGKSCEQCGTEESLEFHHTDYAKKEGFTLCTQHHRQLHKTEKEVII